MSFNAIEDTPFEGVVATFTDTDPNGSVNDFTASIDWGDGETSSGRIVASGPGAFSVVGRHIYANPGSFSVPVSINDISGASASTVSTAAVAPHVNVAPVRGRRRLSRSGGYDFDGNRRAGRAVERLRSLTEMR